VNVSTSCYSDKLIVAVSYAFPEPVIEELGTPHDEDPAAGIVLGAC